MPLLILKVVGIAFFFAAIVTAGFAYAVGVEKRKTSIATLVSGCILLTLYGTVTGILVIILT